MEPATINQSAQTGRPVLRRAVRGRLLGGVAAGVADYFDVDVVVVRIAFVALALVGGIGVPLYLAAWLIVPDEETGESVAEHLLGHASGEGCPRDRAYAYPEYRDHWRRDDVSAS